MPELLHRRVHTMPLSASRDLVPPDRPVRWCATQSEGFDGCPYQAMPGDTLCRKCRARTPRIPPATPSGAEAPPVFSPIALVMLAAVAVAFLIFAGVLKGWF